MTIFFTADHNIFLYLVITLNDVDVQPPEKALRLLQNCTRLLQKAFDQLALARHRGIDHNNKILDFLLLLRLKRFDQRLRGLIYFTDGYGTFPVKKPPYETAFVFLKEDYRDVDVPPWAIKLILEEEDLERRQEDEY